ncbi:MAG: hypothetical protein DWP95_01670 [Proteobacteria bacterium]|nr:MAG: hypothetical protein DWP95_01670 [Pseudomonadota bacterium]
MAKQKAQKLSADDKIKLIEAKYCIEDKKPVDIEELSYTHKLYLLAIFRVLTDESFDSILPLTEIPSGKLLSPSRYMDRNIMDCLNSKNIILVDPNSNTDAFEFEDNKCVGFDIAAVKWLVNISDKDEEKLSVASCYTLIFKDLTNYFPTSNEERRKVISFTMNLAFNEALSYLLHKCSKLNYEFKFGNKTHLFLSQLIASLAVSDICSIIDKAVDEDYLFITRSNSGNNYGSTVSDRLLNLGELAIRDNSQIRHSKRNECLPRSELSKIFYELIHDGDDEGFTECPAEFWKNNLVASYTAEA